MVYSPSQLTFLKHFFCSSQQHNFIQHYYISIMNSMTGFLLVCLVGLAACQRPSYVPNPVRYPDVAPRFRVSTTAPEVNLGNRNGVPTTTERLPIDARGNVDVVNQIKTWPEDKQPFWYVNSQHIENARAQSVPGPAGQQAPQVNVPSRSSFLS